MDKPKEKKRSVSKLPGTNPWADVLLIGVCWLRSGGANAVYLGPSCIWTHNPWGTSLWRTITPTRSSSRCSLGCSVWAGAAFLVLGFSFRQSCEKQGTGLDPYGILPTQDILWFLSEMHLYCGCSWKSGLSSTTGSKFLNLKQHSDCILTASLLMCFQLPQELFASLH